MLGEKAVEEISAGGRRCLISDQGVCCASWPSVRGELSKPPAVRCPSVASCFVRQHASLMCCSVKTRQSVSQSVQDQWMWHQVLRCSGLDVLGDPQQSVDQPHSSHFIAGHTHLGLKDIPSSVPFLPLRSGQTPNLPILLILK